MMKHEPPTYRILGYGSFALAGGGTRTDLGLPLGAEATAEAHDDHHGLLHHGGMMNEPMPPQGTVE